MLLEWHITCKTRKILSLAHLLLNMLWESPVILCHCPLNYAILLYFKQCSLVADIIELILLEQVKELVSQCNSLHIYIYI